MSSAGAPADVNLFRSARKVSPFSHRDPFDRLLVAQANVEDASLVSGDETAAQYPVKVFW